MRDTDRNLRAGIIVAPSQAANQTDLAGQSVNELTAASQPQIATAKEDPSADRRAWRRRRNRRAFRGA